MLLVQKSDSKHIKYNDQWFLNILHEIPHFFIFLENGLLRMN